MSFPGQQKAQDQFFLENVMVLLLTLYILFCEHHKEKGIRNMFSLLKKHSTVVYFHRGIIIYHYSKYIILIYFRVTERTT